MQLPACLLCECHSACVLRTAPACLDSRALVACVECLWMHGLGCDLGLLDGFIPLQRLFNSRLPSGALSVPHLLASTNVLPAKGLRVSQAEFCWHYALCLRHEDCSAAARCDSMLLLSTEEPAASWLPAAWGTRSQCACCLVWSYQQGLGPNLQPGPLTAAMHATGCSSCAACKGLAVCLAYNIKGALWCVCPHTTRRVHGFDCDTILRAVQLVPP